LLSSSVLISSCFLACHIEQIFSIPILSE